MKIFNRILCLTLAGACLLCGCEKRNGEAEGAYVIYYIGLEGETLEKESADVEEKDVDLQIAQMITQLKSQPKDSSLNSAFVDDVDIEQWTLEKNELYLYFNEAYSQMTKEEELLLRAAVVETMVQLEDVSGVYFFVGKTPLEDEKGNIVGRMTGDSFVQNTGSSLHSYQSAELTLYFANKEKDKLIPKEVSVRYNSNTSREKLIVEQLLKGPSMSGVSPVIPANVVLLGVSVKNGICYVNFDESFLNMVDMDPTLTIYALVNSIIDSGDASQVQILVNGESNMKYQGMIDLSKPFTKNSELVEENDD